MRIFPKKLKFGLSFFAAGSFGILLKGKRNVLRKVSRHFDALVPGSRNPTSGGASPTPAKTAEKQQTQRTVVQFTPQPLSQQFDQPGLLFLDRDLRNPQLTDDFGIPQPLFETQIEYHRVLFRQSFDGFVEQGKRLLFDYPQCKVIVRIFLPSLVILLCLALPQAVAGPVTDTSAPDNLPPQRHIEPPCAGDIKDSVCT